MRLLFLSLCFFCLYHFMATLVRRTWIVGRHRGHAWLSRRRDRHTAFSWVLCVVFFAWILVGRAWLGGSTLGLVAFISVPWVVRCAFGWWDARLAEKVREGALPFFDMLRAYLEGGRALPQAIFEVSGVLDNAFSKQLSVRLEGFDSGRALSECLVRFSERVPDRSPGLWMHLLVQAYSAGLPVRALLGRVCSLLQFENVQVCKIHRLKFWARGQILFAAGLPWVLWAALAYFQLPLLQAFVESKFGQLCIAGCCLMQGGGAWCLWQLSRYD